MARTQSFSRLKYQEKLQLEVSDLLRGDFRDSQLQFVSITHVELNADYSIAKVYWDTFDSSARLDIEEKVHKLAPKIRAKIAQKGRLRHTPVFEFFYNSQFEDEAKIERLLKEK